MRHEDLVRLAELVKSASGIQLSGAQLGSLGGALSRVDPALEPAHLLKCADPIRRADLLDRLVDEVTVNETYFMRHADELLSIDWPQLAANALAAGRRLRIWSAACSSGEEPYTLALMAAEALGGAGAPVDVLGTDISPTTLERAQRGVYGARSMRLVSADHRERWFEGADRGSLRVGDQLRGLVRFQRHNLIPDGTPPAGETPFDLVICRNVLIYFHRDTVTRILRGLRMAVAPHGELVLGAADRLGTQDLSPARPAPAAPARRRRSSPAPARPRTASRRSTPAAAPAPAASPPPAASPEGAVAAFEAGVKALSAGDAATAVSELRRALYLDPSFAVAALQLGRAHEEVGQVAAARRAYWRALRVTDATEDPTARLYDRVGASDVAAACRARLSALPEN